MEPHYNEEIGKESRTGISRISDDQAQAPKNNITHAERLKIAREFVHEFTKKDVDQNKLFKEVLNDSAEDKKLQRHFSTAFEKVKTEAKNKKGITGVDAREGFLFYIETGNTQKKVKVPHEIVQKVFSEMLAKVYSETKPVEEREAFVKDNYRSIVSEVSILTGSRNKAFEGLVNQKGIMTTANDLTSKEMQRKFEGVKMLAEDFKKELRRSDRAIPYTREDISVTDVQRAERITTAIDEKQRSLDEVKEIVYGKGLAASNFKDVAIDDHAKKYLKNLGQKVNEYDLLSKSESLSTDEQKFVKALLKVAKEEGVVTAIGKAEKSMKGIDNKEVRELSTMNLKKEGKLNNEDLTIISRKVDRVTKDLEGKGIAMSPGEIEDRKRELDEKLADYKNSMDSMSEDRLKSQAKEINSTVNKFGQEVEKALGLNGSMTKETEARTRLLVDFKVEMNAIDQNARQEVKRLVVENEAKKSALLTSDTNLSKAERSHIVRQMLVDSTTKGPEVSIKNATESNKEFKDETLNKIIVEFEAGLAVKEDKKNNYKETLEKAYSADMSPEEKELFKESSKEVIDIEAKSYLAKDAKVPLFSRQRSEEVQELRAQENKLSVTKEIHKIKNLQVSIIKENKQSKPLEKASGKLDLIEKIAKDKDIKLDYSKANSSETFTYTLTDTISKGVEMGKS